MRVESAFDHRARSRKGARGLMQLMPATAARFGVGVDELFTPARNIEAGTRYLRFLVDRFEGDAVRVFAAYNAGEHAVERYGGVPPYRETQEYVRRVLKALGVAPADAFGPAAGAARGPPLAEVHRRALRRRGRALRMTLTWLSPR